MKTIQKNIVEVFKELNDKLNSFSDSELNVIPFEGSWTAGQVVQHLVMACTGFPQMCAGRTEKTTREPDEKVKQIEEVFLDFETKMNSPEFIFPANKEYNKNTLNLSLLKIEKELLDITDKYDNTITIIDFEVPGFGKFTVQEWISFALTHIKRHLNQLQNISKMVINH